MQTIAPIAFGTTSDGREAQLIRLTNAHGMTADVTTLGACLVALRAPNGSGSFTDVALGFDGAEPYATNVHNFGAPVGRCANRIGGAAFTLAGTRHELANNENGNNLHSGPDMWPSRMWEVVRAEQGPDAAAVELRLVSPDGDQGFPGRLDLHVTYELTADDALAITYEGTPSKETVVNVTNHSYFNLNGHASSTVLGHTLQIYAESYTPFGPDHIPTGEVAPVAGTPLDLRRPKTLREGVESGWEPIASSQGYDHNYVLDAVQPTKADEGCVGALRLAATLVGEQGLAMDVLTDTPGLQLYTANFIGGTKGKGGVTYHDHDAVCLETQFFPDAINHEDFPQPVFGPARPYKSRTIYAFRPAAPNTR